MTKALLENTDPLSDQAVLIAGEIFDLINKYTNDSGLAKFFLTDEIGNACYALAGGFSSVIYTKPLKPNEIQDTTILSFVYALLTYGFNLYLKERSFLTNGQPYTLPTKRTVIKKAQKKILDQTAQGKLASTPLADKIISILIENIEHRMDLQEFKIKGHRFNKKKFWEYTTISLRWGYNFAGELVKK